MQELQLQFMKIKLNLDCSTTDNGVESPIGQSFSEISTTRSLLSPAYEHPLQDALEPLSPTSFSGEERNLGRRRSESPMIYSSAYLTVRKFYI